MTKVLEMADTVWERLLIADFPQPRISQTLERLDRVIYRIWVDDQMLRLSRFPSDSTGVSYLAILFDEKEREVDRSDGKDLAPYFDGVARAYQERIELAKQKIAVATDDTTPYRVEVHLDMAATNLDPGVSRTREFGFASQAELNAFMTGAELGESWQVVGMSQPETPGDNPLPLRAARLAAAQVEPGGREL
jgi:hypothetical protein